MKDIDKILENLFSDLNPKQKKVINERFGLTGKNYTLQAIGDDLDVTRERIRQIESQGVKKLKPGIKKEFAGFIEKTEKLLDKIGGVCRDDKFIKDVKKLGEIGNAGNLDNKLRFIFLIAEHPNFHGENNNVHAFWYKNKKNKKNLFTYLEKAVKFFKKNDRSKILENKIYKGEFKNPNFENFISISKKFGTNVFGDLGLKEWPEIEPKAIRHKAYLVLKKKEEPLHFSDIANQIGDMGIAEKRAHIQTVHNELIKDNRFILVGRGIYSLKGYGYEDGTVREVIQRILEKNGPLNPDGVLKLVNQKKILKKSTILLNLQSKNHFKRLDNGRYCIHEA